MPSSRNFSASQRRAKRRAGGIEPGGLLVGGRSSPAKATSSNRCNAQRTETEADQTFRLLSLEALVRMKLTSYRDKDRTHVRDLIDVGLVDETWYGHLPAPLTEQLQELLENPDG